MAIKHILVPLDGSHLAEAVLPAVAYLAKTLSARVTLLHMIEQDAPQEIHGDRHLVDVEEAQAYLEGVAARALLVDLVVTRHVHSPQIIDVARSIVAHTEEIGADLVVMCSHGRGGLRRWVLGSIAQQVLSLGKTPLLLISPREVSVVLAFNC
jgi:nucleotide-binding universal stress UspA family protein